MEPKFVFTTLRDKSMTAQLQRALKDLYYSPKIRGRASSTEEERDTRQGPFAGAKSSPGNIRLGLLLREQSHCPSCKKVILPRVLIAYSEELRVKHCMCCRSLSPRRMINVLDISKKRIETDRRGKPLQPGEAPLSTKNSTERLPFKQNLSRTKLAPLSKPVRGLGRADSMPSATQSIDSCTPQSSVPCPTPIETTPLVNRSIDQEIKELQWTVIPTQYVVLPGNNSKLIGRLMSRRDCWTERSALQQGVQQFSWHPTSKSVRFDRLVPYLTTCVVNHFEHHGELTNKLNLFKNLKEFCENAGTDVNEMIPVTFALEFESNRFHAQFIAFTTFFKTVGELWRKGKQQDLCALLSPTLISGANAWLLKPSGFNRGRGICVFSSIDQLKELIDGYQELARAHLRNEKPKVKNEQVKLPSIKFVIQKYIERPLLINKRKFDIRMWALVTHEQQGYLYRQGYLRTSSEEFTLDKDSLGSEYVHLTNNAVQKNGPSYGQYEDGNQLSFSYFETYLSSTFPGLGYTLESTFLPRIKDLVLRSLLAVISTQVQGKLNPQKRKVCFELFGYDFIVDEDMKVWLIEVNTNPCLELSSPLLEQLIPNMLDDMLKLTVDKVFQTGYRGELDTPQVVELPSGNNWEHVANLSGKPAPS